MFDWFDDVDAGPSTISYTPDLTSYDDSGLGAWGAGYDPGGLTLSGAGGAGYDTSGLGSWADYTGSDYGGAYPTLANPHPDDASSAFGTLSSKSLSEGPLSAGYTEGEAPKEGITSVIKTIGDKAGKDSSLVGQLKNLYQNDKGEVSLDKVVKAITGLGGLYGAYNARKAGAVGAQQSPQQLQAQLVQNNTSWTPQQAQWANKFFQTPMPTAADGRPAVVRAGEGGIKSIMPSRGYASGGSIFDSKDFKDLIEAFQGESGGEGVVPTVQLVPKLSLPEQLGKIKVHGAGVGMAEGGPMPVEMAPEEPAGPLSHGDFGLVSGEGDGQGDMVPINASPGEYVFDAETVSMLGNGSNEAGADILDQWREFLREHKRSADPSEIGPASKDPNEYLPPVPETDEGVE